MEKALEYLDATNLKTYEIAEKVGYAEANYFSYVFKKHYGVSPSKYRTDRMTAHETGQAESAGS
jgi:two-component system response regulator YesN